jgi:hypothetical protein
MELIISGNPRLETIRNVIYFTFTLQSRDRKGLFY